MSRKSRKIRTEIGEGRSKSIYIEPTHHDTAVLMAFFNPAGFKRILRNVLYIMSVLNNSKIPFYVVECVFKGAKPQIPGATLVVHSDSYMFYKEQLLNKLEPLVPKQYTKLVFIDADIMFDTPDWIDQISLSLNKHDIVQPFNQATWLTPDNTRIRSKKMSYGFAIVKKKPINAHNMHDYHPGFAWAFKRDIFHRIGGFFNRSVIGGGDITFILNLFPIPVTDELFYTAVEGNVGKIIIDAWKVYNENFKKVAPTLGFLPNRALHLFHGVAANRQYVKRYHTISQVLKGTWDQEVKVNNDGLFEFINPHVNETVYNYFKGRNEDIPLEQAERFTQRRRRRSRRGGGIVENVGVESPVDDTLVQSITDDTVIQPYTDRQ
jgi:hypothetical protein